MSQNTIYLWISFISLDCGSVFEADCNAVKANGHEVRKIGTSLLFRRNCAVKQI